jgi:hypothetical protein
VAKDELIGENMTLSNRDKAEDSGDRGQDGKWVQTEQLQDHAANIGAGIGRPLQAEALRLARRPVGSDHIYDARKMCTRNTTSVGVVFA